MRTIKISSNIDFKHLFDNHTEPYALVYTEKIVSFYDKPNERGCWEHVKEIGEYDQVEYFNSINELQQRELILSKITNKNYYNFSHHFNN